MRTYTLLFSILVHVAAVGALLVVPIVATDVLPDPLRTSALVLVTPAVPSPPAPARPRLAPVPVPSRDAAPIEEPIGVQPEPLVDAVGDPATDADRSAVRGDGPDSAIPGSDVPLPPPARVPPAPTRVGGDIRPPQKIVHVAPEYPAVARSARVSGVVILEALIDEDGTVREVKVLRSKALLDEAAVAAVRQWRFTPTLLNGEPIPVVMTVTVGFTLN